MRFLPPVSRAWTCPYYVAIVAVTIIVVIASLSTIVVSWHVIVPIALAFELGILTGKRESDATCHANPEDPA